jgi:hypothetical protein
MTSRSIVLLYLIWLLSVQACSTSTKPPPSTHLGETTFTATKWQLDRHPEAPADETREVITWAFYENGAFRRSTVSDYSIHLEGAWQAVKISANRGLLFVAGSRQGARHYDVLSYAFGQASLQLGEQLYRAVPFPERGAAPKVRPADASALAAGQRSQFFPLWLIMTESDWKSEVTPPPRDPDLISFHRDGRYSFSYSAAPCQYAGTWSLFASGGRTGAIRLSVPAHLCDPRGPAAASVRELPVEFKDDRLFLYKTAYLPLPKDRSHDPGH